MTISAGRSFAFGVKGSIDGTSACVVLALNGVGRDVNGEGILIFCNKENDRERVVDDNVSRDGIGDDDVGGTTGGAGDCEGIGVDGGEDIVARGSEGVSR